ncbi:MAG: Hsp33 family molecular chaperone HslO [Lachnospiraceae bacterium]|nr:Hsp33 family molecular chaperone HslO [Lachnospiraceae bacterium]
MDYMVRGIAADGHVRIFACVSTELCEKARKTHNTSPNVTAALGRMLTGAVIMGDMMKNDDAVLSVTIKSDGPMKGLSVSADSKGHVKGFPYVAQVPFVEKYAGKLDVGASVGKGTMTVVKDDGIAEPYASQINLATGEIADDLTYYFAESEQVPSAVGLGVLVDTDETVHSAGGFVIQMMPDATEEDIEGVETGLKKLTSVTDHFKAGKTPEELAELLLGDLGVEILEKKEVSFDCNCSRERVTKALISVGKKELQSMIDDGEPVEMKCNYCNSTYTFGIDDIKELLASL